jgi:pentatricopeptide repeat protein
MKDFEVQPNVEIYSTLMNAYEAQRDPKEVLRIFQQIQEEGMRPTTATYNILIRSFMNQGDEGQMIQFYNQMKERGVSPNVITFQCLLQPAVKRGDIKAMDHYYGELKDEDIKLDVNLCTFLMEGYQRAGNFDGSWQMFQLMKSKKIHPNAITYKKLIDACGFHSKTHMIDGIRAEMLTQNINRK